MGGLVDTTGSYRKLFCLLRCAALTCRFELSQKRQKISASERQTAIRRGVFSKICIALYITHIYIYIHTDIADVIKLSVLSSTEECVIDRCLLRISLR